MQVPLITTSNYSQLQQQIQSMQVAQSYPMVQLKQMQDSNMSVIENKKISPNNNLKLDINSQFAKEIENLQLNKVMTQTDIVNNNFGYNNNTSNNNFCIPYKCNNLKDYQAKFNKQQITENEILFFLNEWQKNIKQQQQLQQQQQPEQEQKYNQNKEQLASCIAQQKQIFLLNQNLMMFNNNEKKISDIKEVNQCNISHQTIQQQQQQHLKNLEYIQKLQNLASTRKLAADKYMQLNNMYGASLNSNNNIETFKPPLLIKKNKEIIHIDDDDKSKKQNIKTTELHIEEPNTLKAKYCTELNKNLVPSCNMKSPVTKRFDSLYQLLAEESYTKNMENKTIMPAEINEGYFYTKFIVN